MVVALLQLCTPDFNATSVFGALLQLCPFHSSNPGCYCSSVLGSLAFGLVFGDATAAVSLSTFCRPPKNTYYSLVVRAARGRARHAPRDNCVKSLCMVGVGLQRTSCPPVYSLKHVSPFSPYRAVIGIQSPAGRLVPHAPWRATYPSPTPMA